MAPLAALGVTCLAGGGDTVRCVVHWSEDGTGYLKEMGHDERAGCIWLRQFRIGINGRLM